MHTEFARIPCQRERSHPPSRDTDCMMYVQPMSSVQLKRIVKSGTIRSGLTIVCSIMIQFPQRLAEQSNEAFCNYTLILY